MLKFLALGIIATIIFKALPTREAKLLPLDGTWQFSLGDDLAWAAPTYDDSQWETVEAGIPWEEQGFEGYNGYAWYRKTFSFASFPEDGRQPLLDLGRIDDVDEVYLNGRLVGKTGSFPPHFRPAFDQERRYPLARKWLRPGQQNVIAIRVFDGEENGGLLESKIAIRLSEPQLILEQNLAGAWRFQPGDSLAWKEPDFDDSEWGVQQLPGNWESQGYPELDGFAWYRKQVEVPAAWEGEQMVLMLGKIDDLSEVYLNGTRIGRVGNLDADPLEITGNEWQEVRHYFVPKNLLRPGENHVIAIRVYDSMREGGLFEGPIGWTSAEAYREHQK